MTQKIVINVCPGGFGLSALAEQRYQELSNKPFPEHRWELQRNDPYLVQVVEELGTKANGAYAELKVVEIPRYTKWQIDEYDGCEWVSEAHRTWR